MFDLELAIKKWRRDMRRSPSIEESDLTELERYLRDKVEDLLQEGLNPEEAFRRAKAEFDKADTLEAAYAQAGAARPGRRFPWRSGGFDLALFRSNIRIALRRMLRQKTFSLINVGGMALGLAACLFVFLWVQDELGYDCFHEQRASVARIYSKLDRGDGEWMVHMGSYYPLAGVLKAGCPEIIETARAQTESGITLRAGNRIFNNDTVLLADPSLFKIFTFPFVRGNSDTALADKFVIVLTERLAEKYFPGRDPVGETLRVNGQFDVRVSGVIRDVPAQSSLRFDAVVPFVIQFAPSFLEPTHWGGNPFQTWALLAPGANLASVEKKIAAVVGPHFGDMADRVEFRMHSLSRLRLDPPDGNGLLGMIALFSGSALFVLLLACANFTNLGIARAAARAKEIGVRKAAGARKADIVRQFMGESLGTAFLALAAALLLVGLLLPVFNRIAEKSLSLDALLRPSTILGCAAIALFAGLAAGAYPALILSSLQAREALSGRPGSGSRRGAGLRKGLVVFQFALSLVLVLGTAVVGRQISFIKTKDLGFDRDNLAVLRMSPGLTSNFEAFRTALLGRPGISGVTSGRQNPVNIGSTVTGAAVDWTGKDPAALVTLNWDYVDYDYFETLGASFAAGRPFSREYLSDEQGAFVVNETAAKLMGKPNPVGLKMRVFRREGTIVGVVRDFHFRPLRTVIEPIVFQLRPASRSWAFIRVRSGAAAGILGLIASEARRIDPDAASEPAFFDDALYRYEYAEEQKIWIISNYLSATAVFIACIGLFGLAAFLTRRRTKEIGIRKVLGASSPGLTAKLSVEFLGLVALAGVLACPAAYWVSRKLLSPYAYRVEVGFGLFGLAILGMLALAALTVGLQTIRAARANPVESLRYE